MFTREHWAGGNAAWNVLDRAVESRNGKRFETLAGNEEDYARAMPE
jgi:hypothetical protein